MALRYFLTLIIAVSYSFLIAQNGYEIKVKVDGYESSNLILGYQYGGKQYIKDTVAINDNGEFIFKGEEPLEEGLYLLVMEPQNNFVQFMTDDDNQQFEMSFSADMSSIVASTKVTGSPLNARYYEYLSYLESKVPAKRALQEEFEEKKTDNKAVKRIQAEMAKIDEDVRAYHENLVKEQAPNLLSRLINARLDPILPEFTGEDADIQRYLYYKKRYFDRVDLKDEGLLRTGALTQKVEYYVKNLTPQAPDSINVALDYILGNVEGSNNFKFFLIQYLNEYAASKIVGMDAVYVHLVENYYAQGKADWTDKDQLQKIVENARALKPILIGKTAPDMEFKTQDNKPISIHGLEAEYTVLFFWDPDCGHCKKSMPDMISFHDKYQSKGVEVLGICTKVGESEEMKKCWDTVEEKEMGRWVNVADQYLQSGYKETYDIKSTPRIFVLDRDKKIVVKGIGAEQLSEVMDQILLQEESKMEKSGE